MPLCSAISFRFRTMPTYDYVCDKCGLQFEQVQSMKDAALTVCPKDRCGKKTWGKGKVRRQMGAGAGLIFKGSGFYITDYRSEGYKQAAKKDVAPTASSAGESKSSTPAAPAAPAAPAKSEAKPAKSTKAAS
jgi:putative FmdB family regulatory protein